MGGADQWGNITAGLELIRRTSGVGEDASDQPAHGLAYKLLLSPSGTKFGKSVSGDAIWLDPAKTSRSRSTSTGSTPTIGMSARTCAGSRRWIVARSSGWRRSWLLAGGAWRAAGIGPRHHGPDARGSGRRPGRGRQRGALLAHRSADPALLGSLYESTGGFTFTSEAVAGGVAALLADAGVVASRRARRLIAGGGLTVNGSRVADAGDVPELVGGEWLDVRIGKRRREIGRLQR